MHSVYTCFQFSEKKQFISQLQTNIVKTTVQDQLLKLDSKKSDIGTVQSPNEIAAEEALIMYKLNKRGKKLEAIENLLNEINSSIVFLSESICSKFLYKNLFKSQ